MNNTFKVGMIFRATIDCILSNRSIDPSYTLQVVKDSKWEIVKIVKVSLQKYGMVNKVFMDNIPSIHWKGNLGSFTIIESSKYGLDFNYFLINSHFELIFDPIQTKIIKNGPIKIIVRE